MTDLIAMPVRPPRIDYDRLKLWSRNLRIGLFIDWLDSRPEHAATDTLALRRKAGRKDPEALLAALITRRIDERRAAKVPNAAPAEYGVTFHDQIAGHLYAEEVPIGEETYRRLLEVAPDCISALVNLAELERRAGQDDTARDLLHKALERATADQAQRYGIPDATWEPEVHCALARLARDTSTGESFLENARRDQLPDMVKQLERFAQTTSTVVPIHQAFSVASVESRIVLDAAMRIVRIRPAVPPAAHGDFAALVAVQELIRQYEQGNPNDLQKPRYLFGPLDDIPPQPR